MSIKFRVIEKAQPGVKGGGQKKFYASVVTDGEVTTDELVKDIEKFSALSEPDIRGVISALENIIQNKLIEGRIVRLEKLGSLYPVISSKGEEKEEDVTQASIRDVYINYRPAIAWKKR
ncbi:MAG: DNA-binding protein [Bacteroidetes bacterium]|nr:DNA-binding protein [Bacteroidota bacterium]